MVRTPSGSQHSVARRASVLDVHRLEVVDVDTDYGDGPAVAAGAAELLLERVHERRELEHAGQRVAAGVLLKLGLKRRDLAAGSL